MIGSLRYAGNEEKGEVVVAVERVEPSVIGGEEKGEGTEGSWFEGDEEEGATESTTIGVVDSELGLEARGRISDEVEGVAEGVGAGVGEGEV